MPKPLFPRSVRKHIRQEKARIRREVFDADARRELIEKLLQQFLPKQKEEAVDPGRSSAPRRPSKADKARRERPREAKQLTSRPKKVATKKPELAVAAKER